MKQKPYQLESTGDEGVDRNLRKIGEALDEIARTINAGVVTGPVNKQAGDYQITTESFVVYTGPGGHTFTLPKADALTGKARLVNVLNIGNGSAGDLTLAASGSDTINGTTSLVVQAGQATAVVGDGATAWVPQAPLLVNTIGRILMTLTTLAMTSNSVRSLMRYNAKFTASANQNLSVNDVVRFSYEIDAQGHTLTSSEIRGLNISYTETDLGTAAHTPFKVADALNPPVISVIAGTVLRLQTKLKGLQADATAGFSLGMSAAELVGMHGKACVQAAHPVTLADVITILTDKGICA